MRKEIGRNGPESIRISIYSTLGRKHRAYDNHFLLRCGLESTSISENAACSDRRNLPFLQSQLLQSSRTRRNRDSGLLPLLAKKIPSEFKTTNQHHDMSNQGIFRAWDAFLDGLRLQDDDLSD